MRVRQVFFGMLALAVVVLASACGGSAPADKPAETAAPVAAAPAPPPNVPAHMDDHFAKATEAHNALLRGDLEAAKEPAKWIAEHQEVAGLAASAAPAIDQMKKGARQVAEATDIAAAAQGAAAMAVACGQCHAASGAIPPFPQAAPRAAKSEAGPHMIEHERALDLLYKGLIGPSARAWADGAKALKAAPLAGAKLPQDPLLTKERLAAEAAVHALADQAAAATDFPTKTEVYGKLAANCASCHALHGRVWGPGLPKQ
jgi:mono/diheme cytochrome c family protein